MKRYGIGAAALAVAVAGSAQAGDAVQWAEADGGNGHWYARLALGEPLNWLDGRAWVQDIGTCDYASVETLDEHSFLCVLSDCGPNGLVGGWIGLIQADGGSEPDGGWGWLTGEALTYDMWRNPDAPDNNGDADHGYFIPSWGSPFGAFDDKNLSQYAEVVYVEWSADCNGDGIVDYGQILDGTFADVDGNGVPDCCDDNSCDGCSADIFEDGAVTIEDLLIVIAQFGTTGPGGDINDDGTVDIMDLLLVMDGWGECP